MFYDKIRLYNGQEIVDEDYVARVRHEHEGWVDAGGDSPSEALANLGTKLEELGDTQGDQTDGN